VPAGAAASGCRSRSSRATAPGPTGSRHRADGATLASPTG
jgi:hypothetical protein